MNERRDKVTEVILELQEEKEGMKGIDEGCGRELPRVLGCLVSMQWQ